MSNQFNEAFLQKLPIDFSISTQEIAQHLGYNPLYFNIAEHSNEIDVLREFLSNYHFLEFRQQYEHLLDRLHDWCHLHDVVIHLKLDTQPTTTEAAFQLFKSRLFAQEDYYSNKRVYLFSRGKRALEEL